MIAIDAEKKTEGNSGTYKLIMKYSAKMIRRHFNDENHMQKAQYQRPSQRDINNSIQL